MISAPVFCRPFIGRQKELGLILERYRDAALGRGSIVLIGGEAGIGKTRFLSEARSVLERAGARYVEGQCLEHTQSPFGPFIEVLGELNAAEPAVLAGASNLRAALGRLLPELTEPERGTKRAPAGDDRHGQYLAMLHSLERFANVKVTAVAIEDLHWADLATLECIQYLALKIADKRALLMLTYRSDELHRKHALTPALARLARAQLVWRLELGALAGSELQSFVHHALEGHASLGAERLHEIGKLTEGNPLFLEELLKHALESAAGRHVGLPLTVSAAVLERLAHFDPDDRAILTQAAVIGRHFQAEFLAKVSAYSLEQILAVLRRARELQLIVEEREGAGGYAFRHALVREALYSELLAAEASALHQRIATELELLPQPESRVVELAYQWWAARMPDKAARYNELAGDAAAHLLAHEDAAMFYGRALEFASELGAKQAELYAKLGSALGIAGYSQRASRALERALRYYENAGDARKTCELCLKVAAEYYIALDPQSHAWRLRGLEAIRSIPSDPLYYAALVEVARAFLLRAEAPEGLKYLAEAERFGGIPAPAAIVNFFTYRGLAHALLGETAQGIAAYQRAVEAAAHGTDLGSSVLCHTNLGSQAIFTGELESSARACEEARRLAREGFMPLREASALAVQANAAFWSGDLALARELLAEADVLAADFDWPFVRIQMAGAGIPVGVRLEDEALIERHLRHETLELAFSCGQSQMFGLMAVVFAELYIARGEARRAEALIHRAGEALLCAGAAPFFPVFVAAHGDAADIPKARAMLAEWSKPNENRLGHAYVALFDAHAGQREGKRVVALAEDAARRFAEIGFPDYEAQALELAERPAAALEIYRRIGDRRAARRLEQVLMPVNKRGRLKTELTTRESEIAQLVAQGKSNRAIAEALVISERTVENHLTSIFSKLNVQSRSELTAHTLRETPAVRG